MKAKELAEELMKNPEALVSVWIGEPNDSWAEVEGASVLKDEYCQTIDGWRKVPLIVSLFTCK